jgi:3',5'-cyclic AMP phosphodiesterase CpdA
LATKTIANPTSFRYLFRFRDLVAATLEEHEKIINSKGSCWWGWWKRPSETSRLEVWKTLKDQIAAQGEAVVGLFDSGTGLVHKAWIKEVILPDDDAPDGRVAVPKREQNLVPPYYRESPFSRAWMRIVRIERNVDFFDHYSFSEAPILPNYDANALKMFVGKVVRDKAELTGMDTTIWSVRSKRPGDIEQKILLSIPSLPEPVSANVVSCQSNLVLHLTDVHFATGSRRDKHVWKFEGEGGPSRRTLVEAVTSALQGRNIGLILVTGDFSFVASKEEFDAALASMRRLLGIFNLSTDQLVIIPGNHDIKWTNNDDYDDESEVTSAPDEAKAAYATFYQQLYRHEANEHLSMGRRFLLPNGISLEICAVNSSALETGKNFLAGIGRIDEAAIETVANRLGWNASGASMALRILMIHHHLALTEDLESPTGYKRGFGLAIDAVRVQRMAAKLGVQLALHGHKHRAFLWRSFVFELPENAQPNYFLGELAIIGGGSAGSIETEGFSNYFNLLDFEPEKLDLTIYRSRNRGNFDVMQRWFASLTMAEGSGALRLGIWKKAD